MSPARELSTSQSATTSEPQFVILSRSPLPWPPPPIPATLSLLLALYPNARLLSRRKRKPVPHKAEVRRKFRRLKVFFMSVRMPASLKVVHPLPPVPLSYSSSYSSSYSHSLFKPNLDSPQSQPHCSSDSHHDSRPWSFEFSSQTSICQPPDICNSGVLILFLRCEQIIRARKNRWPNCFSHVDSPHELR